MDRSRIIADTCLLLNRNLTAAREQLQREYPFESASPVKRAYAAIECTETFFHDGFIDRYSGERLVFPGSLRLLSIFLPDAFPFHPNWKTSVTHRAYWELFPTLDHIVPVSRGGVDEPSNWVTTSQLRNSAKGNWTLEELGWKLVPPGDLELWDGTVNWFVGFVSNQRALLQNSYLRIWFNVARQCLANKSSGGGTISR